MLKFLIWWFFVILFIIMIVYVLDLILNLNNENNMSNLLKYLFTKDFYRMIIVCSLSGAVVSSTILYFSKFLNK
jgi:uncharacterized protein YebE (UPF0316 family)